MRIFLTFATMLILFSFSTQPLAALEAEELLKIEALINRLESKKELIFVRNGKNYTAEKAANHLRRKLNRVKDKLSTVDEFIDNVASASSLSREPYRIIKPNGESVETKIYLRELLREIN
jgi:hypothetical protein